MVLVNFDMKTRLLACFYIEEAYINTLFIIQNIPMKLYFITGNESKFKEVEWVISNKIELIKFPADLPEPQTTDLREISRVKALAAWELVKKPVIVDDTGNYFDAYHDFPGPFAKFAYKQLWFEWFKKLLNWVTNTWWMTTVVSYMDETLIEPLQFIGTVTGEWKFDHLDNTSLIDPNMPYNNILYPEWSLAPVTQNMDRRLSERNQRVRAIKEFNKWVENQL